MVIKTLHQELSMARMAGPALPLRGYSAPTMDKSSARWSLKVRRNADYLPGVVVGYLG